jgi:hypothetical protein
MFWRNILPPSSRLKSKPSKKSAEAGLLHMSLLKAMWHYNVEDHTLLDNILFI